MLPNSSKALDLKNAVHIGHSTGGGEVTRYVAQHGKGRVAKAVLISAIPPQLLKSDKNPDGLPMAVFDQLRDGTANHRSQFFQDITIPFYGFNRPGAKVSQGIRDNWWRQGMMGGIKAQYDCIRWLEHDSRFRHGPTERTSCEPSNFKTRVINAKSRIRTRRKVNFQQAVRREPCGQEWITSN